MFIVTDQDGNPIYTAGYAQSCHEHINDAINEFDIEGAGKWKVVEVVPKQRELELLAVIESMGIGLLNKPCNEVPPGNGYCDKCAEGLYEQCRYASIPSKALREHGANVLEELIDTFAFFQTEEGLWLANAIRGMAEERRKK